LLAALDALRAKRIQINVNLKVIFEGEEEAGFHKSAADPRTAQEFAGRGSADHRGRSGVASLGWNIYGTV
jgi:hypothetical protein